MRKLGPFTTLDYSISDSGGLKGIIEETVARPMRQ